MDIIKHRILFSLVIFLFSFSLVNKGFGQNKIPFFRINTSQGLSQSTVYCAFQDSDGYLWFGTSDGLNRYDGYEFKVFRHIINDPNSLTSNDILSINEDSQKNIWIGTRTRGISKLNKLTWKFDNSINKSPNYDISNSAVNSILRHQNGEVWFAAGEVGIFKQNLKKNTIEKLGDGSQNEKRISASYLDKNGDIWFGNNSLELIKFVGNKKTSILRLDKNSALTNNFISGIVKAKSGQMYITTNARGLYKLDLKGTISQIYYQSHIIDEINNMKAIACDQENRLLIPTNDGLLIIPNENENEIFHQKANSSKRFELSTHALMSIFVDKNQNIWIGTWEGGLNVFYKKQPLFGLLRHEAGVINGPLERKITSIAATDNTIWLGTNIGLSEYNRKADLWRHYNDNQLSGKDINSLFLDSDGDLFISVYQKNLNIYNNKTQKIKEILFRDLKPGSSITTFAKQSEGKTWIGTRNNGLYLFDKKTATFEAIHTKFPKLNWNISISAVKEDHQRNLWVGMAAEGLYKLNLTNNTYKIYKNESNNNLSDEHILAIFQDHKKRIWIGTNGGGLNLYNPSKDNFTIISEKEGLPNNTIKAILEDQKGALWVSTNQGICNFNYEKNTFKKFSEPDGLQGKEFGRGVRAINQNGELFFGGSNGLNYFHPNNLHLNTNQTPKIIFSGLKLFNKNVEIGSKNSPLQKDISHVNKLELKNSQSVFTIEFLALDFQQLKNYQYAYKLEGFDQDWNYVGTQRSATYTNMPAGNYTLKVKSTNNEGVWAENTNTLKIIILPPWYRTISAYFLYFIILVVSLLLWRKTISTKERLQADIRIQKIEAKKIKELDIAKTHFFTNISHEFRTPLTLIISPVQEILQNKITDFEALNMQHNVILKNAQRLLRLINQILDISKLEAGSMKLEVTKSDLVEFLNSIAISFKSLAEKEQKNFTIDIKHTQRYVYFDPDIIEKITYNLLSNAFKFTPKDGEISLFAEMKNQYLRLEVADNGIGMDSETQSHVFERYYQAKGKIERKSIGTGIGLALTKELVELHQGTIEVVSSTNMGSKFVVELPVDAKKFDLLQIKEHFDFSFDSQAQFKSTETILSNEILLENDAPLVLLVEDNEELREYLVDIFKNKFKILEAENGQVGLQLALESLPDLILSDYLMPIMDGGDLCKAIKSNEKTSHIPFVMLTSKKNNTTVNYSYDLGADDYILKPFNVSLLIKKIETIIRARSILKQKFGKAIIEVGNEFIENTRLPENASDVFTNEVDEKFFKKAINIIEANLDDPNFDVNELENSLNMSKMQLYRKLKGVSNFAPNEFIRNVRLKKAADLMQASAQNVSEIAYAVGFNDPAYFARCFRKQYNQSPTDFMNRKVT